MKKNLLYISFISFLSLTALYACNDDDNEGRAINITVVNAVNISGDIFAINVTEGTSLQLESFIMPAAARNNEVIYEIYGESTGAITITENGLITPLLTTPATGTIPQPLGTDTIIALVNDGSGTFVKYPVRVISSTVLVSSITLQSAGQNPEIEIGKTFNLAQYVNINPTNATNKEVTYCSEDETVATVDETGIITAVGNAGESTKITITAKDRGQQQASCFVSIAAEAPLYLPLASSDSWTLSSNLGVKEGALANLLDDNNSTFWAPLIEKRPIYSPYCYLDIDLGEIVKFGQLGYRHRALNYSHLQLHSFILSGKANVTDEWTALGTFETESLMVDNYQLFQVDPVMLRYLRLDLIKGHLRSGKTDWDYEEDGNVSIGDLLFYVYNR